MHIVDGVVHVSFAGGGVFLPARSVADRNRVEATVQDRMRVTDRVQVLSGGQRWEVRRVHAMQPIECHGCGTVTDSACFGDGVVFCVACALIAPDEAKRHLDLTGWDEV
ncbi:hypothetical protein L6Q96_08500 [Candidatus Binatia bacterium]|nr:hypothetical protein [Candidatus Binatia bacterium]